MIRLNPDYGKAHYNLGLAYGKSGMYTEAIESNKQAIRLNPDYTDVHDNLARLTNRQ